MKKIIHFAFISCCLFLQSNIWANTVIVKGYVKDSANHAVANRTVKIYSTDSTNQGCLLSHTSVTNPNGYYIDTLTCVGDIRKLSIIVETCNGSKITNNVSVTTSNIVESNFTICVSPTIVRANCRAAFSYTSVLTGIKFNGAGSEAPDGDSIISRSWSFGDSSETLTGNNVDPLHAYKKPGIYSVCLTVKTKKGCESKYCNTVVYTPESNECRVEVIVSSEKIGNKKFRFISSQSHSLAGDSIVQRTWKFGDGSSLDGNQLYPTKEYKDTGLYTVCLKVRTAKDCEKLYCFTITVRDSIVPPPGTSCKALFTFSSTQATGAAAGIRFNASASFAPAGDSIISRSWSFGDSTVVLTGNNTDPTHVFSKAGTYHVCLTIKTKKGCESNYCATVVYAPLNTCFVQVHANIEKISPKKFRFTSNTVSVAPGDSIIHRVWKFGDNTSVEGNEIYPVKEYRDTGVYTVCVTVKTARGCENQHCFTVTVHDSTLIQPKPTNCKAYFTYAIKDSTISFNSAGSTAPDGDSIISRTWYYIDSTKHSTITLSGNVIDTFFTYAKSGTYPVYLSIKTKKGCESKFTVSIVIVKPNNCRLQVQVTTEKISQRKIRFNSSLSNALGDSIVRRTWKFGDGTGLEGNEISPLKEFKDTGVYNVCVKIKSANGCEKEFCLTVIIRDSLPKSVPTNCKAAFTYSVQNMTVKFNSSSSTATSQEDSIISRIWIFGDTTNAQFGNNIVEPYHTFTKTGSYNVYLYIKTKKGCESKYAATVVIASTPLHCEAEAYFTSEKVGLKKVQFNSNYSKAQQGDSIIERRWKFGDGTGMEGNNMSPLKEFPLQGVYSTCLQIKTAKGCETQFCRQVTVQDSVGIPQTSVDMIKIISINPNPVTTRMVVTIWCRNNNTEVEISIHDIYGTGKLNVKKVLTQGNNAIEISTEFLNHGPYFLKVSAPSTRNGRDTKAFYKL